MIWQEAVSKSPFRTAVRKDSKRGVYYLRFEDGSGRVKYQNRWEKVREEKLEGYTDWKPNLGKNYKGG